MLDTFILGGHLAVIQLVGDKKSEYEFWLRILILEKYFSVGFLTSSWEILNVFRENREGRVAGHMSFLPCHIPFQLIKTMFFEEFNKNRIMLYKC